MAEGFEDAQTYVVWNRAFPPTPFTHSTVGGVTTIDTGHGGVNLRYTGGRFSAASLSITMAEPNWLNVSTWTWSSSSEGNLFGTFHNLDGLNGWQDMNCSNPDNGALGPVSSRRRRDCHSAAPPLPLVGVSIGMKRGCQ